MKYILPIFVALITLSSCAKKKAEKQAQEDESIIQKYIVNNSLTASRTDSGLYYVIEQVGNGTSCNADSDVRVAYKGYYTDGSVFDESGPAGVEFNLQQVIQGWTEGIPYFTEGGSGKLLLPSALAYGPNGSSGIPPNAVMIFDVELIEVL